MSEVDPNEGWINNRPLILDEPGSDYAIAFANERSDFKHFIQDYKGKAVLDLACGKGAAVREMRAMGIDAVGVDLRGPTGDYLVQSAIEDASTNPKLKGRKFPLVMSVQGFGVYASDPSDTVAQVTRQFQSISELIQEGGLLIFTTTGGTDNVYGDYHNKPVPAGTLFELRYTDHPTPRFRKTASTQIPLLELAKQSGFEHLWQSSELPKLDQERVIKLRYTGRLKT